MTYLFASFLEEREKREPAPDLSPAIATLLFFKETTYNLVSMIYVRTNKYKFAYDAVIWGHI